MAEKIQILNLCKEFHPSKKQRGKTLQDINLAISKGDFLVILGRSGCGKSTLLNIMAGMLPPTSGDVLVDGKKITGTDPSRSILFQDPSLLPWLSVEENIAFGCRLRGDHENLKERVKRFISIINLTGFEKYMPSELSVGMRQRVCLARAFIGSPDILLMDEPFGALDTFTRTTLQDELINIWQRHGFTVVFVTHDIDEAIITSNRIVLMGDAPGRIIEVFKNDLPYPRNLMDEAFLKVKVKITERFRASIVDEVK